MKDINEDTPKSSRRIDAIKESTIRHGVKKAMKVLQHEHLKKHIKAPEDFFAYAKFREKDKCNTEEDIYELHA